MSVRFLDRRDVGGGLWLHRLSVSRDQGATYTHPGQYVNVAFPEGRGYFALVGPLAEPTWELLVRPSAGEASTALSVVADGELLDVSHAKGKGFPIDEVRRRPLVLALAGSAIGLARPLLASRLAAGDLSSTWLYAGVQTPEALPLAAELVATAERGVRIVVSSSRADVGALRARNDRAATPTAHRRGYVQSALEADREQGAFPKNAVVFAAGPNAMVADIVALGRTADFDVYTNV